MVSREDVWKAVRKVVSKLGWREFAVILMKDMILETEAGDVDFSKQLREYHERAWKLFHTESYTTFATWLMEVLVLFRTFVFKMKPDNYFTDGVMWYVDGKIEDEDESTTQAEEE